MKVEIKKININKKIFNQIVKYNLLNNDYNPLGWCNIDNVQYIVFYNEIENKLSKCTRFFKAKLKDDYVQIDKHGAREKHFYAEIGNINYDFKTDLNKAKIFIENVENIIKEVKLKWQFYL